MEGGFVTDEELKDPTPDGRGRRSGPGNAVLVLFAAIGVLALVVVAGLGLVVAGLHADDAGVQQAADRLDSAASGLPDVVSASSSPGLGDLGTQPRDIYGDVRLAPICSLRDLSSTAARLAVIIRGEHSFRWHPTVWCGVLGATVSPVDTVTRRRIALLGALARDRLLTAAAVVVEQRGDDASPDLDDSATQVKLYGRARATGSAASRWVDRVRGSLPAATITATTGRPGDSLDPLALQEGQWTVIVQASDVNSDAVLRTAVALQTVPAVAAAYVDGPNRQVVAHAATWNALRDLQDSLGGPSAGQWATELSVTARSATPSSVG